MSLVEKIDSVVAGLRELADELIVLATAGEIADVNQKPAEPDVGGTSSSEAPAAPAESVDAEQVRAAAEGHDNALPFKCPACGKTYDEQVVCMNGHAPEATLATADVLDGAKVSDQATPTEPAPADPPPTTAGA